MSNPNIFEKLDSGMLRYCKIILKKLSFNKKLQRKEYEKSQLWLTQSECLKLKEWMLVQKNFALK